MGTVSASPVDVGLAIVTGASVAGTEVSGALAGSGALDAQAVSRIKETVKTKIVCIIFIFYS